VPHRRILGTFGQVAENTLKILSDLTPEAEIGLVHLWTLWMAAAEELEMVASMFPSPDGEPSQDVLAAASALRLGQPATFVLSLPLLLPGVRWPCSNNSVLPAL